MTATYKSVAAGDIVQNILRPSIRQPDPVRVATVPGRVVLFPLTDRRGENDAIAGDLLERGGKGAGAALGLGRHRDAMAARRVEHRDFCGTVTPMATDASPRANK